MNYFFFFLLLTISFLFSVACSKSEKKTVPDAVISDEPDPITFSADQTFSEDSEDVPAFLLSKAGFLVSAVNNQYASFEIAIRSIYLVDFNGNYEKIVEYETPESIDLAREPLKRLLVFDNYVFASEYERLLINFDVGQVITREIIDGVLVQKPVFNFRDFTFSSEPLDLHVSINGPLGVSLRSDEETFFDLQFNLDHSLKVVRESDNRVRIFRPTVKVTTQGNLPSLFSLAPRAYRAEKDGLTLLTGPQPLIRSYTIDQLGFTPQSILSVDGGRITPEALTEKTGKGLAVVRVSTETSQKQIESLFFTEGEVVPTFNQQKDSLHWLDDALAPYGNPVYTALPPFAPLQSPIFALGQAGTLFSGVNGRELVIQPLRVEADLTATDSRERHEYLFAGLNRQLFLSDLLLPEPFRASLPFPENINPEGERWLFHSYLEQNVASPLEAFHFEPLPFSYHSLTQSEFESMPVISSMEIRQNKLSIYPAAHGLDEEGASADDPVPLIVSADVRDIRFTVHSHKGVHSMAMDSYLSLNDSYERFTGAGALLNTINYSLEKASGNLQAIELVFLFNPYFYDALAHLRGEPLRYYPEGYFDAVDLSFINFAIEADALDDFLQQWIDYDDLFEDESLEHFCDNDDGAEIQISSYCRGTKLARGEKEKASRIIDNLLFPKIKDRRVRDVYLDIQSQVPSTEQEILNNHYKKDKGYFPKRLVVKTKVQRAEKIISTFKKVYKTVSSIAPEVSLRNLYDRVVSPDQTEVERVRGGGKR